MNKPIASSSIITYIEVSKIDPHPNNPRKDVGDVSELAESIKQNGIMQNLTVVPWFSQLTGAPADNNSMDGYYRALIGHRRLAAAKLAGLGKVPCVIATNLTPNEQVAIMLAENMQRADLTIPEQAEGIQMMFDLGDTVDSVSQKTGLSKTTVRRRAKLMEYNKDDVKTAFERGATIADYELLEKVNSPEKRSELIKKIGTNNFKWEVDRAIDGQKQAEKNKTIFAFLDTFATRIDKSDYNIMYMVSSYSSDKPEDLVKPDDYDESKKYYYTTGYGAYLYVEKEKESTAEAEARARNEAANKERSDRRDKLSNMMRQMEKSREDFIRNFSSFPAKKAVDELICVYKITNIIFTEHLGDTREYDLSDVVQLIGIDLPDKEFDSLDEECEYLIIQCEKENVCSAKRLLAYAHLVIEYDEPYNWSGQFIGDHALAKIYEVFEICGYQISDEEKAMLDGTHELYLRDQKEASDNG